MTGTLTVRIGDATHQVLAGESITFDSSQPHLYRNDTDSPVEFLVSVSPPTP